MGEQINFLFLFLWFFAVCFIFLCVIQLIVMNSKYVRCVKDYLMSLQNSGAIAKTCEYITMASLQQYKAFTPSKADKQVYGKVDVIYPLMLKNQDTLHTADATVSSIEGQVSGVFKTQVIKYIENRYRTWIVENISPYWRIFYSYTSPTGRNHYRNGYYWSIADIVPYVSKIYEKELEPVKKVASSESDLSAYDIHITVHHADEQSQQVNTVILKKPIAQNIKSDLVVIATPEENGVKHIFNRAYKLLPTIHVPGINTMRSYILEDRCHSRCCCCGRRVQMGHTLKVYIDADYDVNYSKLSCKDAEHMFAFCDECISDWVGVLIKLYHNENTPAYMQNNYWTSGCGIICAGWIANKYGICKEWIKNERGKLTASKKQAIKERDHNACTVCGNTDNLVVDHIFPVAKGGFSEPENLRTLCAGCNSGKRDTFSANIIYNSANQMDG